MMFTDCISWVTVKNSIHTEGGQVYLSLALKYIMFSRIIFEFSKQNLDTEWARGMGGREGLDLGKVSI